eukprot:9012354-Pyramimonas_sp.AAC.1
MKDEKKKRTVRGGGIHLQHARGIGFPVSCVGCVIGREERPHQPPQLQPRLYAQLHSRSASRSVSRPVSQCAEGRDPTTRPRRRREKRQIPGESNSPV